MSHFIGRESEKSILQTALDSGEAEFIAIYGRRRVGKTYLVREYIADKADLYIEFTGQNEAKFSQQLLNFKSVLEKHFEYDTPLPPLESWNEAFQTLADAIDLAIEIDSEDKIVIFLDELPWMATRRSGLLSALDYYWNTRFSKVTNLTLIVCGSAASWIIDNLIDAKGGLHNRVTQRIRLMPFTISETREYFEKHNYRFKMKSVLEIYMAIGGIPLYLKQIKKSLSTSKNIDNICFSANGLLSSEFERLFSSLFGESDIYELIVRALAKSKGGISRDELILALGLSSGGGLNKKIKELEESGFISKVTPYNKKTKHSTFRVIDPYVYFYLKWIDKTPNAVLNSKSPKYWLEKSQTPSYKIWAGYAFENLCLSHPSEIKKALGLDGVSAEYGSWSYKPPQSSKNSKGAQIDLLFDRADNTITLCEVKFNDSSFSVTKAYAGELKNKLEVFHRVTRTTKDLRLILVTVNGFKRNTWSEDLVDDALDTNDIFQ